MKFQFLSDLHLERDTRDYYKYEFTPTAPYLLLGGDIGNISDHGYAHFILRAALSYLAVVFILGNHEPFGLTHSQAVNAAKSIASKADNVYFLNNEKLLLDDTTIYGTTLYSHIPETAALRVVRFMPDYRYIKDWKLQNNNAAFSESLGWLSDELRHKQETSKVLVLTHHAPTTKGVCDPKYTDKYLLHGFATELSDRPFWKSINVWAYGHTHYNPGEKKLNGVRLITNMQGYPNENVANFDPGKIYEI